MCLRLFNALTGADNARDSRVLLGLKSKRERKQKKICIDSIWEFAPTGRSNFKRKEEHLN